MVKPRVVWHGRRQKKHTRVDWLYQKHQTVYYFTFITFGQCWVIWSRPGYRKQLPIAGSQTKKSLTPFKSRNFSRHPISLSTYACCYSYISLSSLLTLICSIKHLSIEWRAVSLSLSLLRPALDRFFQRRFHKWRSSSSFNVFCPSDVLNTSFRRLSSDGCLIMSNCIGAVECFVRLKDGI